MAGRKPRPTAAKKLEGNPRKRKQNTKELNECSGLLSSDDIHSGCSRCCHSKKGYDIHYAG